MGVILESSWAHPGVILSHPGVPSEGLKSPGALEKLSGGGWWHSDYNLCSWSRSLSFSEIL